MQLEAPAETPRKVFTLLVEMRCNSYCLFCGQREVDEALVRSRRRLQLAVPRHEFAGVHARYTLASATETLERARSEGFSELSFQGGEPTIWPDLPALATRARAMGFEFVGMVTNGRRLADRAYAEALIRAGLHGMTISLLGPDAETHDTLSAAPGAFAALMEGMRNVSELVKAHRSPLQVSANLIVTAQNIATLDRCIEVLAERGVRSATLHLVRFEHMGSDPAVREMLRFDVGRLRDAVATALDAGRAHGVEVQSIDVPECLHDELDPARLARRATARDVALHHFQAADFQYRLATGGREEGCEDCMVRRTCARVPPGHTVDVPYEPITLSRLERGLDDRLASMDPAAPDAASALVEQRQAYECIERIADRADGLASLRARIDEALADVMAATFRRENVEDLVRVAGVRIGFVRRSSTFARDADWAYARRRAALLEQRGAGPSQPSAILGVGPVDVLLDGTWDERSVHVSVVLGVRLRGVEATPDARRQLVAVAMWTSLLEGQRLEVDEGAVRIVRAESDRLGWQTRPGAVRLHDPRSARGPR